MKNLEAHFKEIKKQYPKTMSKDQLYRVAHISKATALYLLQSGAIPCKDTGKKTRRYQESLKSRSNNTDKNDTDFSDTDSFPFTSFRRDHGREAKGNEAALRERYRELIAENIAYDALLTDYPYEQDTLEEILELLVDVVCTTKSSVRISGDDKPAEVVRSRFLKLNSEHIRFVVGGLKENTTRIRNMRQYLLATLYNAPLTIGNYYRSLVSHDMSEGFI